MPDQRLRAVYRMVDAARTFKQNLDNNNASESYSDDDGADAGSFDGSYSLGSTRKGGSQQRMPSGNSNPNPRFQQLGSNVIQQNNDVCQQCTYCDYCVSLWPTVSGGVYCHSHSKWVTRVYLHTQGHSCPPSTPSGPGYQQQQQQQQQNYHPQQQQQQYGQYPMQQQSAGPQFAQPQTPQQNYPQPSYSYPGAQYTSPGPPPSSYSPPNQQYTQQPLSNSPTQVSSGPFPPPQQSATWGYSQQQSSPPPMLTTSNTWSHAPQQAQYGPYYQP